MLDDYDARVASAPEIHPVPTAPNAAESGSGVDWTLILTAVGTGAAIVSAIAVIAGFIYWLRKRGERAARALREETLISEVSEVSDGVVGLREVVAALAEEARSRRPQLIVRFITGDGPSPSALVVKRVPSHVDVEAILEAERRTLIAAMPPIVEKHQSTSERRQPMTVDRLMRVNLGLGVDKYLPVTQEDHDAYQQQVEQYLGEIRDFVEEWAEFTARRRAVLVLTARIDNDGGGPAERSKLTLEFPSPCDRREVPLMPDRPGRPKFERRISPVWRSQQPFRLGNVPFLTRLPHSASTDPARFHRPTRRGPFYEEGSLRVVFEFDEVPHHEPIETEAFEVGIPEPGQFPVKWRVGAANLSRPEEGTLYLEVRHEEAPPVETLVDLLNAARER